MFRYGLPALVAVALFVALGLGLRLHPGEIPSPLIGKPAPAFTLETLEGGRLSADELRGQPLVVNFFASWCVPCLSEHPLWMALARDGRVRLIGINYKDAEADARNWLARHGNPYALIARDLKGTAGLDWGVYGVPETFLVDADGVIRYKQTGPMTREIWEREFVPRLHAGRG